MVTPTNEGFIPFRGHRTWYRVHGDGEERGRQPVLVLHGGPGLPCDYLEPLADLAASGRRIIFYDQLGCGNSDHVDDPSLWTVELFVEEVVAVRRALGLEAIHLLGHSWGGMLALEYVLTRPVGITSLVLASATPSMPLLVTELHRLRDELPAEIREIIGRCEANGTTDSEEYGEAVSAFLDRHFCRLPSLPDCLARSFAKLGEAPQVCQTMFGTAQFDVTGTLNRWDASSRPPEIKVPTLLTSGRHDQMTPMVTNMLHEGIRGSEWALFEDSSHMAHLEEPALYRAVILEFLERVERAAISS